jgi:arsenical resistance protein ArsH
MRHLRSKLPSTAVILASRLAVLAPLAPGRAHSILLSASLAFATLASATNTFQHQAQTLQYLSYTTMTVVSKADLQIWNGEDKDAFDSLSHPGYSEHSDLEMHTGGWLAHRAALSNAEPDWVRDEVADMITKFDYLAMPIGRAPKILVLYGSLRETSFSRKLAYEFARLLEMLGCDVRVYNPRGLPVRDPILENHIKVQELRALTHWSDGHMWVSPEMHGTVTGVFKNQIDWIPLNTGSVRPTQGKTCCVAQVNGGSQSFNAVNYLRLLARWMRMPCSTNQSSVPKAWQEFDDKTGRMKASDYRDRVVDVAEEFAKVTAVMVPVSEQLTDRYSERMEKLKQGRLLSQHEKEKQNTINESRKG